MAIAFAYQLGCMNIRAGLNRVDRGSLHTTRGTHHKISGPLITSDSHSTSSIPSSSERGAETTMETTPRKHPWGAAFIARAKGFSLRLETILDPRFLTCMVSYNNYYLRWLVVRSGETAYEKFTDVLCNRFD
jgi:hypothetical protein